MDHPVPRRVPFVAPIGLALIASACGPAASGATAAEPGGLKPPDGGIAAAPEPIVVVTPVEPPSPPEPFTGLNADEILALDADSCRNLLDEWDVPWAAADDAPPSIERPLRLAGPAGGVLFLVPGADVAPHDVLDCRMAVALAEWGAQLGERGVVAVESFGFYRRGPRIGSHVRAEPTQHNYGLGIDVARFELEDGTKLTVLDDWSIEDDGASWTCDATPNGNAAARLLEFFCAPAEASIFHVYISPAHDREHRNHFHFDLGGGGEGGWFLD